MHRRTLRAVAGAAAFAFAITACGQKPGVHVDGGQPLAQAPVALEDTSGGGQVVTDDGGLATTDPGDAGSDLGTTDGSVSSDSGAAVADAGGGTTSGDTSTSTGSSASAPSGGSSDAGSSAGQSEAPSGSGGGQQTSTPSGTGKTVKGNDRTGAGPDKLVFASHAPVTGAAPLPTTSFEKSGDLYWRYLTEMKGQKILGRSKVEILFRDDKYDPNSARQVCRELASKAFVVSGGGGTDQIQACGQFAQVAKVPYFSAGVTEAGLRGNPWYYAASMSYRQQGILLAQMIKKNFPGKKIGAIVTDTPNFDDAVQGWEQGLKLAGLDSKDIYKGTLRHPKGDTSWYNAFANELSGKGVEVVYILSSPVDYIRFAQQATQGGFKPQYVGVGVSMGLNAVLGSGCPQVDGGMFFSPFPGLDFGRKNVPEFFEAGKRFGAPTDDIALALWGTNEVMHKLLASYGEVYGDDLTREDFRDHVETQAGVAGKVFPPLDYSPQDHFGSKAVHLLKANCSTKEYETVATFRSSF